MVRFVMYWQKQNSTVQWYAQWWLYQQKITEYIVCLSIKYSKNYDFLMGYLLISLDVILCDTMPKDTA